MSKASPRFAHAGAHARVHATVGVITCMALLALLVMILAPLTHARAAAPGAPRAVPHWYPSQAGTNRDPLGCLTVKESVTAEAGSPANLAQGWTIKLSGPAGGETTTDDLGVAQFFGLASGTYTVTEVVPYTFQALTPTTVQVQVNPSLTGENCSTVEFRSQQGLTSCIDGTAQDEANRPLAGWNIYAQPADGSEPTFLTLTGEDGTFHFPDLTLRTWTVWEDVPPDWIAVTPARLDVAVSTGAGQQCIQVSFKNRTPGLCIDGTLTDAIANLGVPGAPLTATLQSSAWISTTHTDARGYFRFGDLDTGTYAVTLGAPAGWAPVGPTSYTVTPTSAGGCSALKFWVRAVAGPVAQTTACRLQHRVMRGDTIGDLAYHYRVSSSALVKANKLSNANRIYVGQKLCIP